jgi:hypothetical protein
VLSSLKSGGSWSEGDVEEGLSARQSALPKNNTELRFLFLILWSDDSAEGSRSDSPGIDDSLREDFSR